MKHIAEHSLESATVSGLQPGAIAVFAAQLLEQSNEPLLCILPSESQAQQFSQDLSFFSSRTILHYPGYEIPPYTPLSPDPQTTAQRLSTLYSIQTIHDTYVVISSVEALLRKVMPTKVLTSLAELIIAGEETDLQELITSLIASGYEQMSLVQNAGEFSHRGGILDIFPPGFQFPIRLDFFGDFVETIRTFDPISQRSVDQILEAEIIPVHDVLFPAIDSDEHTKLLLRLNRFGKELDWNSDEQEVIAEKIENSLKFPGIEFFLPAFYDKLSSPLAYIPQNCRVLLIDTHEIKRSQQLITERISANYNEACQQQSITFPPDMLFLDEQTLTAEIGKRRCINFIDFEDVAMSPIEILDGLESKYTGSSDEPLIKSVSSAQQFSFHSSNHKLIRQHIDLQRKKQGLLAPLVNYLHSWLNNDDSIHIACRSHRHATQLFSMLEGHGLPLEFIDSCFQFSRFNEKTVSIYPYPLTDGFDLIDEKIHFLSEQELFGEKRFSSKKRTKAPANEPPINFEELKVGDIVVNSTHGLGVYDGIINMTINAVHNDFLVLSYKDNDKLYIPVDRMNTVSKYNGLSEKTPVISRLGSKQWVTAKKKVQEAVWKVAQSLLNLYARRKLVTGITFSRPDSLYTELEESFPYDETPGQIKAINNVIDDLTREQCMDRLVCGDVGFGKTEVAVRAAFKVVTDGYQVAILVPTTVLAEQHAQTFKERLEGFPVTVECLNRFRTPAQQRKIVADLNAGKVDIIIGTHRILSKDVIFNKLGLLIIDEEHRFGVSHKEKLKMLKTGIDVLTLTATPIPRTLQMSLLGVRDLSVISSPPRSRRSIKTFIAKYSDLVVKEAIIRELQRGGQVFFVHNRVRSIHDFAFRIQNLVPEAKIAVAHGQMPAKNLEEIMVSFVRQEINVLISTTIIESGLDIPNANTIIINRADRMGLAEIYQLRGRVGRSSEQAYAYLLVPSLEHLPKDAKQRLKALMEYNELGGGFKLALSDLQIRGGGNILGESQSGNISAVGYDLYLDLLQKTVEDLKRRDEFGDNSEHMEEIEPEINLLVSAYIPDTYITDSDQRYIAYRRLSSLNTEADLDDLAEEFTDRYGKLPEQTTNLFSVIRLKPYLKQLRISKLEKAPEALVFSFADNTPVTPQNILLYIENSKNKVRLTPDGRLVVSIPANTGESIFEVCKNILRSIR
nr:transcription-repair coupling factor [Desulfobulbaceae bacterium]